MVDVVAIIVRFGLYLDLMILYGVPLFGLYGLRGLERSPAAALALRKSYAALAIVGLLLSSLGIALLTASMSGVPFAEIEWTTVVMLISETNLGVAWQIKMAALLLFLFVAFSGKVASARWAWSLTFLGAVALATMAWSGHGAMSEGRVGSIHLAADIVHLLAAGAWMAALVSLVILLFRPHRLMTAANVELSHCALARFAVVGTVVVTLLFISGLVNSWLLVGWNGVGTILTSLYGQLLFVKLVLFLVMLGLAALNRYRMTPALEKAIARGDYVGAINGLRRTLVVETGCAIAILGLVAVLGTLAPPVAMI